MKNFKIIDLLLIFYLFFLKISFCDKMLTDFSHQIIKQLKH